MVEQNEKPSRETTAGPFHFPFTSHPPPPPSQMNYDGFAVKGNAAKGRREEEAQRGKRVKGKKALANRHGLFYP